MDEVKKHADMTIEELMRETGFERDYAEFFLAMARGELDGDLEDVDDDGHLIST